MALSKLNRESGPVRFATEGWGLMVMKKTAKMNKVARIFLAVPAGFAVAAISMLMSAALIIDRIVKPIILLNQPGVSKRKKAAKLALMPFKVLLMIPPAALCAALLPAITLIAAPILIATGAAKHAKI